MRVLLIDNGTKHLPSLLSLLSGNLVKNVKVGKAANYKGYDLIILSGGSKKAVATNPEYFKKEIDLIKSSETPIIGVCEGCELIAYTYGGLLIRDSKKTLGLKKVRVITPNVLNLPASIRVYEAHRWNIKKVHHELVTIARSDNGIEILKHKDKNIIGLQFHPEMFPNLSDGKMVFRKILNSFTQTT